MVWGWGCRSAVPSSKITAAGSGPFPMTVVQALPFNLPFEIPVEKSPPESKPIVFIVDDDFSVREALESLVRSAGFDVETFASGQDFLARHRPDKPSCLVLDVRLPGLSGLDLQKRIIEANREI